jgi:hypothetical protein
MLRTALGHARLMRESTDRVQSALHTDNIKEQLVARRIVSNAIIWQQWESEHSILMRRVAEQRARHAQIAALKRTSFRLVHGKALFQHLRESEVRGPRRMQILAHFHPGRIYEHAVIAEHSVYLRKACSFLCTSHVGSDVVQDPKFLDPMQRYEELFTAYFNLYCSALVGQSEDEPGWQQPLLPLLKHQLNEWRAAILDPKDSQPIFRRDADLRRPTGDTQLLRTLGSAPKIPR